MKGKTTFVGVGKSDRLVAKQKELIAIYKELNYELGKALWHANACDLRFRCKQCMHGEKVLAKWKELMR